MMVDLPFLQTIPGLEESLPDDLKKTVGALQAAPASQLLALTDGFIRRRHRSAGGRIEVAVAPSIPAGCSDEFLTGCVALAREHGVGIHTHLDETKVEAVQARRRWGISATRHLASIAMFGPNLTAAHSIWITEEDMSLLSAEGVTIAHNPASNMRIGSGLAPIREALDHGIEVALGTDGAGASDSLDMYTAMRMAALVNRVRFGYEQDRWLGSRDVFKMATGGGAQALGGIPVGMLERGALADVVLLRLDAVELTPLNDALNALVFRETGSCVETVIVDGRVVVENGDVLTVDERAVREHAVEAAERMVRDNQELWRLAAAVTPYLGDCCRELAKTDLGIERFA
jgi:cytosine/adenosine deaminase-related metal-dependent hydrolase